MGNQCQNLIPSRLNHVILISHQTNNFKLRIIEFSISIYDNIIGYL